jgi:putative phosphoserine phosphatase/1-acylglycerol-3-phosphate O-acyltransferase
MKGDERLPGAAIFDLDRTLVRGATGPAFAEALRAEGVLGRAARMPGSGLAYRLYDAFGETLAFIALARAAARAFAGLPVEAVRRAGDRAVAALEARLRAHARPTLREHREAGRLLVLATTSPAELVAPFAEALGFDELVATRYAIEDGRFTGRLAGTFVWGMGKRRAVSERLAARGVSLAASFAYSDSVFDVPLLAAVGQPRVVNPDARLALLARAAGWPVVSLDVPEGVITVGGRELARLAGPLLDALAGAFATIEIHGVDRVPSEGPAILAANHRSYFDFVALGVLVARLGRPTRFLAKRELFELPVAGRLLEGLGGIPVDRGSGSSAPLRAARRALEAGELVVILPQGTIPRGAKFFERPLEGKTGVARLAAATGAPVVPVGLWGTELVWPRASRLPRPAVGEPPVVTVRVGESLALEGVDMAADTRAVMQAIEGLLPAAFVEPTEGASVEPARRLLRR